MQVRKLSMALVGSRGPTIGECLARTGGTGPNFNIIRLSAAFAVLVSHAFAMPTGDELSEPIWILSGGRQTLGQIAVTVFFALSGFLVTPSLIRSRAILPFALKRALRLLPALIAVLLIMSLVLGPLLSSVGLLSYFTDPQTYLYPIRALYNASYTLPGVFSDAPFAGTINGSLWTLKYESESYVLLAAFGLLGVLSRPRLTLYWALAVFVLAQMLDHAGQKHGVADVPRVFFGFFQFFVAGVAMAVWKNAIPVSKPMVAAALLICGLSVPLGAYSIVAPALLSYAIISLGVMRQAPLTIEGDFSYGLYLWAFPVQQIVQTTFRSGPAVNVLLGAPIVLIFAFASWHLIEQPCLHYAQGLRALQRKHGA